MHNRRVATRPSTGGLPLYSDGNDASLVGSSDPIDTLKNKDRTLRLRDRFHPTTKQLNILYKSILFAIAVFLLCMYISHKVSIQEEEDNVVATLLRRQLLVNEFPSLKYPLEHSTLVGLYFAASWCPQSTPVTKELDKLFQSIILKPPPPPSPNVSNDLNATTTTIMVDFSIVYVSSDNNLDSMERYIKPNWFYVPFENVKERSLLKERFKTCAKKELSVLGFTREHEIPTLVIFSTKSSDAITYNGIDDVADLGVNAIHHWLEMEQTRQQSLHKK